MARAALKSGITDVQCMQWAAAISNISVRKKDFCNQEDRIASIIVMNVRRYDARQRIKRASAAVICLVFVLTAHQ